MRDDYYDHEVAMQADRGSEKKGHRIPGQVNASRGNNLLSHDAKRRLELEQEAQYDRRMLAHGDRADALERFWMGVAVIGGIAALIGFFYALRYFNDPTLGTLERAQGCWSILPGLLIAFLAVYLSNRANPAGGGEPALD